jgi:prevent-host-death family protein
MKTVSAAQANREFSKLLRAVQEGETVTITSHGKVVARLVSAGDDEREKDAAWLELIESLKNRPLSPDRPRLPGKFQRDWAYDDE